MDGWMDDNGIVEQAQRKGREAPGNELEFSLFSFMSGGSDQAGWGRTAIGVFGREGKGQERGTLSRWNQRSVLLLLLLASL